MKQKQSDLLTTLHQDARDIFFAGLAAADPTLAVDRFMNTRAAFDTSSGHLVVIALGKAACPMMKAALGHFPDHENTTALVVTNIENECDLQHVQTLYGEHPVPGQGSLRAGQRIFELLQGLDKNDRVLLLLSGGGSALQVCPPNGISLEEKAGLAQKLIQSGADITEINTVRKCLSRLKGGGFARQARPARITTLILSDVPHDELEFVASGPSVCPTTSGVEARNILETYGLWTKLDPHLQKHFLHHPTNQPPENYSHVENILIGGNTPSVEAAKQAARPHYQIIPLCAWLNGDVADAAKTLLQALQENAQCNTSSPTAFICGGETTVRVKGKGAGGRNQELALHFALEEEKHPVSGTWVFLSAGTDGRDGPTDAAGALVDVTTLGKIRDAGIDLEAMLADNNSYHALAPVNALFMTGGTGTNVADLQILLHVPPAE